MKFVKYTGITWSDVELAGLLEDEDSHVSFERFKKHLGLHPFHLTNLSNALNEILCSKLNSYDTDLKGFIVAYKNPKLLTPLGEIVYDSCFIHIDIEADFYVFRPKVGISLKGIVKKIVPEHIGVVVHKAFTVIVLRPTDDKDWVGNHVQMLQEVRITLTVLNLASKVLSYIGGIFDPDDYLRGCRLPETHVNTNCISFNDDIEDDTDTRSRKSPKQSKHMFFESDSDNASEEDISPTKKKRDKNKKLNKSLEQEVVKYAEKEKKDKRRSKKVKEVKESESPEYTNSACMNGNFTDNEKLEEFVTPKSKLKKKSKRHSSQSSINEDVNEECEKYLSMEISQRLSDTESDDKLNKIKLKQKRTSNGLDWCEEENTLENKVKLKKNSRKRKNVDSSDHSTDEFSSYKYTPHSSKRNSKSLNDNEETSADIKMENLNSTNKGKNKIKASPKKKQNMDLETSESEGNRHSKNVPLKGKSKNSKIQNTKVKTERATSGSENTQDEDYIKTIKVPRMDSELDVFTHSFSCDLVEDDGSNTGKKQKKHSKNKIKIEPEFDIITKVERSDNEDEDIYEEDLWNSSKINSPKKKHKAHLGNSIESDETDTKSNTKYFNKTKTADKRTKSHNIKVEVDSSVINSESDNDYQNTYTQKNKAKLKHEKVSSDSDFDFNSVKIKTEKFLDDY